MSDVVIKIFKGSHCKFNMILPIESDYNLRNKNNHLWCKLYTVFGLHVCPTTCSKNVRYIMKIPLGLLVTWILQVTAFGHLGTAFVLCIIHKSDLQTISGLASFLSYMILGLTSSIGVFMKERSLRVLVTELLIITTKHSKKLRKEFIIKLSILGILSALVILADATSYYYLDIGDIREIQRVILLFNEDVINWEHSYWFTGIAVIIEDTATFFASNFVTALVVVFFSYLCKMNALLFDEINQDLSKAINYNKIYTNSDINNLRKRYQIASKLSKRLSDVFSPILLLWLAVTLLAICFDLRLLPKMNGIATFKILGFIQELIFFFIVCHSASEVNKKAKATVNYFSSIVPTCGETKILSKQNELSSVRYNALQFTLHLATSQQGIDVSNLFLLDMHSIFTMIATVVTYAVVLYQTT